MHDDQGPDGLTSGMDACHARACAAHRDLLRLIARADRTEHWRGAGARDMAHWLWMRYGVSDWKARRWIVAAHALESLPRLSEALDSGELGIDKVVELCRFATPETEADLLRWAARVSAGAIRRRGDVEARRSPSETRDVEQSRYLRWWSLDEGRRLGIEAELPAAQGDQVVRAIEECANRLPEMPGEEGAEGIDARRADALVTLACARTGIDPGAENAMLVVHVPATVLESGEGSGNVESGGVIHAETARRLGCSGRIQVVVEDQAGNPLRLGRASRDPSLAMRRLLRHRDGGCVFPGCGSRAFAHPHHIVWWSKGGRTDLENLVLVCTFHHRLVHEHGWSITRSRHGHVSWFRPDGSGYRAGPAPPEKRPA